MTAVGRLRDRPAATTARAELVTFATGRTMSVRAHAEDGDSLVFSLRAGGEMTVDAAMVSSDRTGRSAISGTGGRGRRGRLRVPLPVPSQSLAVNADVRSADHGASRPSRASTRPWCERSSRWSRATSREPDPARARSGLMQVMPANWPPIRRDEPVRSVCRTSAPASLTSRHCSTGFRWRWRSRPTTPARLRSSDSPGIPPYPETVDYVSRIRALVGR